MKRCKIRLILKIFAMLGLGVALFAGPARAEDIFVNTAAPTNGDGSAAHPYWRITDAVTRARRDRNNDRIPQAERIVIHVAPGTYKGTYASAVVAQNPHEELLPIVLNVPTLTLSGATVLALDERGLPTGVMPGAAQTTLTTTDNWRDIGHSFIIVCRTTDGGAGDNVTISGLTLNGSSTAGQGIAAEHVSGFTIGGNVIQRTGTSVGSRLASGTLVGNLLANDGVGAVIQGGSTAYPAQVTVQSNRIVQQFAGLAFISVMDLFPGGLQLGDTGLTPLPLQVTDDGIDVQVGLDVQIVGNDISHNTTGVRLEFYGGFPSQEEVQSAGRTTLNATVSGNSINANSYYGLSVEAGSAGPPQQTDFGFSGRFIGRFSDNKLVGNASKHAVITFTSVFLPFGNGGSGFWYLRNSSYEITDMDGELADFDRDAPLLGPVDGSPLANTFLVNGVIFPAGMKITLFRE